MALGLT